MNIQLGGGAGNFFAKISKDLDVLPDIQSFKPRGDQGEKGFTPEWASDPSGHHNNHSGEIQCLKRKISTIVNRTN